MRIPASPLALNAKRQLDERRQRALTRYYCAAGAGGIAVYGPGQTITISDDQTSTGDILYDDSVHVTDDVTITAGTASTLQITGDLYGAHAVTLNAEDIKLNTVGEHGGLQVLDSLDVNASAEAQLAGDISVTGNLTFSDTLLTNILADLTLRTVGAELLLGINGQA